jgi:H+-transporting ATPase
LASHPDLKYEPGRHKAIKESRKIFQRMNSYAIYRVAETLRVLLFMTLSILIFNFYPVTEVMIVMLALLNDGATLMTTSLARISQKPGTCAWCWGGLPPATVLNLVAPSSRLACFCFAIGSITSTMRISKQ